MTPDELRKKVNKRYFERKSEKHNLSCTAPEILSNIRVQSDQVNALIDVLAEMLP